MSTIEKPPAKTTEQEKKDRKAAYQKEYREKNRARHNERAREWNAKNPDKAKASVRKWADANPRKRSTQRRAGSYAKLIAGMEREWSPYES